MSELQVIKAYYEQVVAEDFPHLEGIGEEERRVKAGDVKGCHGDAQNLLFYSFEIEGGCIEDVKYECQYCGPTMYVVGEVVAGLLDGRPVDRIAQIDDDEIVEAVGGKSRNVLRAARTAIRLIGEAIDEIPREQ